MYMRARKYFWAQIFANRKCVNQLNAVKKYQVDETGFEPMTFRMQSERATNCATRPRFVILFA